MPLSEIVDGMPLQKFLAEFLPCDEDQLNQKLDSLPPTLFNLLPSGRDDKDTNIPILEEDDEGNDSDELSAKNRDLERKLAQAKKARALEITNIIGYQEQQSKSNYPDFSRLSLAIEIKAPDIIQSFHNAPQGTDAEIMTKQQFWLSELDESERTGTLARIMSTMTEMCERQYRTHVFMIFFQDPHVRFLRGDRAGVIVSEAVNYRTNSRNLAEFFWRFSQASDPRRGMDTTVQPASTQEVQIAATKLAQWKPGFECTVVKIDVPQSNGTIRQVLAWHTKSSSESLTGRGTRAIPVWDIQEENIYFLKDSWRAEHLEQESDILRDLHINRVKNIPQIIAGRDLYNPADPSYHRTITQDYANAEWHTGSVSQHDLPMEGRVHHRLLEDFILESISACKTAKEMVIVIYDALVAHSEAFEAGVLHRDISDNNVLMIRDPVSQTVKGILADWDMALRFSKDGAGNMIQPPGARQRHRRGTWYFMSALLLQDVSKAHRLQDDLESFFHLGLYLSLHWFPWTGSINNLEVIIDQVFGQYYYVPAIGFHLGGLNKQLMIQKRAVIGKIKFTDNLPLTSWIDAWFKALAQFYRSQPGQNDDLVLPRLDRLLLSDHSWILQQTKQFLDVGGWSTAKNADFQEPSCMKRTEGQKRPAPDQDQSDKDSADDEGVPKQKGSKRKKLLDHC
ncbi:hypothetical protein CPB83DRAFT_893017 [Crepidotus variabilis]|uniref:Protein kinase domain-containing protein n=1 Tax=Crepidotus variabilis TaxID=179855 RepID=A0A9P6EK40_9AGAR|nr:hypothetical protein CPB83DRAFT_893017 [Crepidotus variabilis]